MIERCDMFGLNLKSMHSDQVGELIEDLTFFFEDDNVMISRYNFISFLTFRINLGKF